MMSGPDETDETLWRSVTEGVAPLKGKRRPPPQPPPATAEPPRRAATASPPNPPPQAPPAKRSPTLPPLVMGQGAGVDKRRVQRLKRGQIDIEARLDLHGLTQKQAHARLDGFLADAQDRGLRCVLVITGKGRVSQEGGALRRLVPLWLNGPPCRERVLTMSQAQPKDGGGGAIYLLLKRRR
jgi:DNA-nicking Smr family endonuclease